MNVEDARTCVEHCCCGSQRPSGDTVHAAALVDSEIERLRGLVEAQDNGRVGRDLHIKSLEAELAALKQQLTALRARLAEVEGAGDRVVSEVKNLSVSLFGIEGSWRDSKAMWWKSLVNAVDAYEAAKAGE